MASASERFYALLKSHKADISGLYFFAVYSGALQLVLPLGIQSVINYVIGGRFSTSLVLLIAGMVASVFVIGVLQVSQMRLIEKIQQKIFADHAIQAAVLITHINFEKVHNTYMPELYNRFFDVIGLQKSFSKLLLDIPAALIQIVFGLLLLTFYHPVFILFSVLVLLLLAFIVLFTGKQGMETALAESTYKYKTAANLQEMARTGKTVRFTKGYSLPVQKTDLPVSGYLTARTKHFGVLQFQYKTLVLFQALLTAVMLVAGSYLLINRQLSIGQFIASEIVIITVLNSVSKLITNLDQVYDMLTSLEKIGKITGLPTEAEGVFNMEPGQAPSLEITGLRFGYGETSDILKNLDLKIPAGSTFYLKGAPGAGKTLLLQLLCGTYTGFEGSLLINRLPIGNYNLSSLRRNTGLLLNRSQIFAGTLLENIALSNPETGPEQIADVAEKAGFTEFLKSFPQGLQTLLEPEGTGLPNGLAQQILLLRALCGKPGLLLLHKPLSYLEPQCAATLKNYLMHQTGGATVVITGTDDSFTDACRQTALLENGSIKQLITNF